MNTQSTNDQANPSLTAVRSHFQGDNYRTEITDGIHTLIADEPMDSGGADLGFDPFELVLAGLAACTTATVKMYADRKGWPLTNIDTHITLDDSDRTRPAFQVSLQLDGSLDTQQRERLLVIATKCPVHKLLLATPDITTVLAGPN